MNGLGKGIVAATAALVLAVPAARAATVEVQPEYRPGPGPSPRNVHVNAGPGEVNVMDVRRVDPESVSSGVLVTDVGILMGRQPACLGVVLLVHCGGRLDRAIVDLGDRDDRLTIRMSASVNPGSGRDFVDTRASGAFVLDDQPAEADEVVGSNGLLAYDRRGGPISVTLDGLANDGEDGESDQVGVPNVTVSWRSLGATLIGDARPNRLWYESCRNPGRLEGGEGDDYLRGCDVILGGPGDDRLEGNGVLDGGPGRDTFGIATLLPAEFRARDGEADSITCPTGAPVTVLADPLDTVINPGACAILDIQPAP